MYTEEINKVALSSNDNKKLQTFDRVTTFSQVKIVKTSMKQNVQGK